MKSHALTTGVVTAFDAPFSLCSHVEWAVNGVLGAPHTFRWKKISAAPDRFATSLRWEAPVGTGARIASALLGWTNLRFEIIEDPMSTALGTCVMRTPSLGTFTGQVDDFGSIVLTEHQIDAILSDSTSSLSDVTERMHRALGRHWDRELEPLRIAASRANVTVLQRVGER